MTEATPRPSGAIEATLLKARQYIQDTVPCQRIVHGSCSKRSCYIANGWDGVPPVAVEPRCKEFQIIADIDALVYPMEGRVNNYDEALVLLREAGKSLWGGVAFDRDVVVDLSARIDAFLAKEKGNG